MKIVREPTEGDQTFQAALGSEVTTFGAWRPRLYDWRPRCLFALCKMSCLLGPEGHLPGTLPVLLVV